MDCEPDISIKYLLHTSSRCLAYFTFEYL